MNDPLMMFCKNCGATLDVEDGQHFCDGCNMDELRPACLKCGAEIMAGEAYCDECSNPDEYDW